LNKNLSEHYNFSGNRIGATSEEAGIQTNEKGRVSECSHNWCFYCKNQS